MKLDPTLVNYLVVVNIRGADPMLTYAAYIFMAAGGLALIVGFFGCCGAMRDNQPLLFIVSMQGFYCLNLLVNYSIIIKTISQTVLCKSVCQVYNIKTTCNSEIHKIPFLSKSRDKYSK